MLAALRGASLRDGAGGPAPAGRAGGSARDARVGSFEARLVEELAELRGRLLASFESSLAAPASPQEALNGSALGRAAEYEQPLSDDDEDLWPEARADQATDAPAVHHVDNSCVQRRHSLGSNLEMASPLNFGDDGPLPNWQARWARLVVKLTQASNNGETSIADLTVKVLTRESSFGDEAAEEAWVAHPEWLSSVPSLQTLDRGRSSSFAMSLVDKADADDEYATDHPAGLEARARLLRRLVVHPDSNTRFVWTFFGALLLLYDSVTIPLEAVDLITGHLQALVILSFVYWTLDVLFHAICGYATDHGVEMQIHKTVSRYARTWMPLDIGVLILDAAFTFLLKGLHSSARTVVLLRLLRLVRLVRLHKWLLVFESFMRGNTSKFFDLVIKIGQLMLLIVVMCHYIACIWYGLGAEAAGSSDLGPGPRDSWLDQVGVKDDRLLSYTMAFHWSITQFTPATNNIVPVSTIERVFAIVVVLWGMLAFSVFLSSITSTVNELKTLNTARTRERFRLVQFIKSKRIHSSLGTLMLTLFDMDYNRKTRTLIEEDLPMLKQLPESVRIRMHREYFMPYLKAHCMLGRIFHSDKRLFLRISHEAMSDHRYMARQEVFLDGVDTRYAFVVVMGLLMYHKGQGAEGLMDTSRDNLHREHAVRDFGSVRPVRPDAWLAEGSMWLSWAHRGSLVASSCAELLKLNCEVMRQIVRKEGGGMMACMRCCAILFAHELTLAGEDVSDLTMHKEVLQRMALRALRFCQMDIHADEEQQEEAPDSPKIPAAVANQIARTGRWVSRNWQRGMLGHGAAG